MKMSETHATFIFDLILISGCCFRVKVGFTRGQRGGAFKLHPYMFTYYRMEPGMINGRNHYTSEDGRFAISYCGDSYWIQRADTRYSIEITDSRDRLNEVARIPCSCLPVLLGSP